LDRLLGGLRSMPGVEILSLWGPRAERIGVVTFTVAGWEPALLAAALSAEHGIGVRDGGFCAHPLVAALTDPARPRPALRASFGAASTRHDIDRLLSALEAILSRGLRWRYGRHNGRFVPDPDPRPVPDAALLGRGDAPEVVLRLAAGLS
ncbi:MAG TPA: aminotransferase class V-fold PLP-dependent enzyme, partial [Myxococcales bacterium]|nr:aminotransferase class V-fold PLP-dependent enzyme [Myxococcales bacterium]